MNALKFIACFLLILLSPALLMPQLLVALFKEFRIRYPDPPQGPVPPESFRPIFA